MRTARKLGPLNVDNYEYPPTFLIVPRLLGLVTPDFWGFRRLWFALNFGFVVVVAVLVARRLDERLGTHAVWLTPFVIAAPSIVGTFQAGNVQMVMIALTALALYCFDRRANAIGGALLAFAIAGKLYPGVFVLYLLLRGEWRAVAWTAAFGVALLGLSLADVGWAPYGAFLNEMPGLMSGEAFAAFRNPSSMAANGSVPGVVFKLKLWGVPYMGLRRDADRRLDLHDRDRRGNGVAGQACQAPGTRAGNLDGHPRPGDDAESVHGDLRLLSSDVARDTGRAARLARLTAALPHRAGLVCASVHVRAWRHPTALERGVDDDPDGHRVRAAGAVLRQLRTPAGARPPALTEALPA